MTQESNAEKARRALAEQGKRDDCIQPDQAAMEPLLDSVAVLRGKRSGHALSDGEEALRHYSIVAAMLDPKGPHGLGNEPLKAFFDTVSPGAREYILQGSSC